MHTVAGLAVDGFLKGSLIIGLDGSRNSRGFLLPAFSITLGWLIGGKPGGVLGEHYLVGGKVFMELGLEALLHHFLNLLVSDLVDRGDILDHRQAEASNHQAESKIFHIIF